MEICKLDYEQYENVDYCPVCSYRRESELLKENIVELNKEILRLTTEKS